VDIMSIAQQVGSVPFKYGENLSFEYVYSIALSMVDLVENREIPTALAIYDTETRKVQIHINPNHVVELANQLEWGETEITAYTRFLIKHELLHFMLKHLLPDSKRQDPTLKNIVVDAIVNPAISELQYLMSLDSKRALKSITPEQYLAGEIEEEGVYLFVTSDVARLQDFTWEMYYDYLLKQIKERASAIAIKKGALGNDVQESDQIDEGTKANMEEIMKKLADAMQLRGDRPGNLIAELKAKTQRSRLEKYLKSILLHTFYGKHITNCETYKRPNRRFDSFPGNKKQYVSQQIVVMIDDSGSVSEELLEQFVNHSYTLAKAYGYRVDMFVYDTKIQNHIPHKQLLKRKLKLSGRGGTNLKNALKELQQYDIKNIHTMLIFTDGYDEPPTREEIPAKKVVFAFPDKYSREFKNAVEKFAKTIVLE